MSEIPRGWPREPKFSEPGTSPGAPIQHGESVTNDNVKAGYGYIQAAIAEKDRYFYHPDHIGSTSIITDVNGMATQFVVYMPFGESFVDEHTSRREMPYKFSGKERDEETGLSYFGARYYDAGVGIWYGVDPLTEKYPGIGAYVYCVNNPIRYIDPDGNDWEDVMVGYGMGVLTNIVPASSSWRDLYTPTNSADYNNALQAVDLAAAVIAPVLIIDGGKNATAGLTISFTSGAVLVGSGGTTAPVTVPGIVIGGTVSAVGVAEAALGADLMYNSVQNASGGYDRGKKSSSNGSSSSSLGNGNKNNGNSITFTQGTGNKAQKVTTNIPKGYKPVKGNSHGQKVFSNGKNYISPDRDGHHNGGIWKMGKTREDLGSKKTRMGTYDANLKRIGDYYMIVNDRWRYKAVGITAYENKFQPIISYSDIGETLTADEYILIENNYIEAVKIIMQLNKCEELIIRYLEKNNYKKGLTAEEDEKLHKRYIDIKDKQKINYKDIDIVMKLILREIVWCDLINLPKRLYVRFGYDYYMYFNTRIKKDLYRDKIEKLGLFVS